MTFAKNTLHSLKHTLKPGTRTAASLACNISITCLNGLVLSLAVAAAGGSMFWPLTIAVLSVGALLGAAVPTPGGLGGVEAGILGGLIACGVPAAAALAATVIYRGLTYWMPIIPGLTILPWVRKHYLP
jgi:undecaprenyl-diphosphatase